MNAERDQAELRIRALCERNEHRSALALAIELYGADLLRFIAALVHDTTEASDVFSQVCEDLCEGLPTMKWKSSLRTWAYAVARNACYSHLRGTLRKRQIPLSEASEVERLAATLRARTLPHLRTDVKDRFAELRATLTPDEQSLLTLRIDRDLEWNEIAEILADQPIDPAAMKRTAAACRQRFVRLTDKLRLMAASAGLLDPDVAS